MASSLFGFGLGSVMPTALDHAGLDQPSGELTATAHSEVLLLPLAPRSSRDNVIHPLPPGNRELFPHLRYRKNAVHDAASYVPADPVDMEEALRIPRALYGGVPFDLPAPAPPAPERRERRNQNPDDAADRKRQRRLRRHLAKAE